MRLGNFDAAFGDIVGSCLFNFGVISLSDIVYTAGTVFGVDSQSLVLSACLSVAALFMLSFGVIRRFGNKLKNSKTVQIVFGTGIMCCYITFLIISTLFL